MSSFTLNPVQPHAILATIAATVALVWYGTIMLRRPRSGLPPENRQSANRYW